MSNNKPRPNELRSDLLSTTSLNCFPGNISSPRLQMFNSHLTQALITEGRTPRRCFTGMEPKFGEYTFGTKLKHDIHVIKAIQRYPKTIGINQIKQNPETLVIYEYDKELSDGRLVKEVDCFTVQKHHALHQSFGYELNQVTPITEFMAKDSVITQSPSIDKQGNYCFGLETNVAMMSVPGIIEDGVVASESFCQRMKTTGIETFTLSWGKKRFPLNIYGDDTNYKPFPDIGEVVGDDGILVCLRKYDPDLAPVTMIAKSSLRKPDFLYDECVYVEPGAEIIDIKVHHDQRLRGAIRGKNMNTPVGMYDQTEKYLNAEKIYHHSILNVYRHLYGARKEGLRIGPNFNNKVVQAMAATVTGDRQKMSRTYRGVPIDEWYVEITIKYPIIPTVGFKLTGTNGDKGVICEVRPDADMPVDIDGNRVELIVDGHSTISRMNVSRCIEQYYNAAARDVSKRVRLMAGDPKQYTREDIENYLLPFYHIVNPKMVDMVTDDQGKLRDSHLQSVLEEGIYLWIPTDCEREPMEAVLAIQQQYPPTMGPLTYRGASGEMVTTVKDILVGSMYIMLLEKTGKNWAGVASAKLSHFGVPAKLTTSDRHSSPGRPQPIRFGESEGRLFAAFVGGRETADLFDRSNNPAVRKAIQERLLTADQPTNIDNVVDRRGQPNGNGRILSLIKHFGECAGWRFKQEMVNHHD